MDLINDLKSYTLWTGFPYVNVLWLIILEDIVKQEMYGLFIGWLDWSMDPLGRLP